MSRALIMSLGGTPEPLIFRLRNFDGSHVLFFASEQTRDLVEKVRDGVQSCGAKWPTHSHLVVTPDHEQITTCYETLSNNVPQWQTTHALTGDDIEVDFTGGTKAMSAALVLFASLRYRKLGYVGGQRTQEDAGRTKDGVGIVKTGKESEVFSANPFDVTLDYRWGIWQRYSRTARFALIAEEAKDLQNRTIRPYCSQLCGILAGVYHALDAWDRFASPGGYLDTLEKSLKDLDKVSAGKDAPALRKWYDELCRLRDHVRELKKEGRMAGEAWIYDLLANAERRATCEHKYEDAAARLYSCFERLGQIRLKEKTGSTAANFPISKLPARLHEEFVRRYGVAEEPGIVRLPLNATMRLLSELGDEQGKQYLDPDSPWIGEKSLLRIRNNSILGHGHEPVTQEVYERFRAEMIRLWNLNPERGPKVPELPETP